MHNPQEKLIVALDVPTFEEAKGLVGSLGEAVELYKVGSQLFTACGPKIIEYLAGQQKKIFLDLKYHDIPNTVAHAVSAAVGLKGVFMCTLHTVGGEEMLKMAVAAAAKQAQNIGVKAPLLVGITVLTSEEKRDNIHNLVMEKARLAQASGLDGVVASSQEAAMLRREFGKDFVIVTPGIRPAGADAADQKRVTTPLDAVLNGSNFLVVGRPIVQAVDPVAVARHILEEIKQAQNQ